MRVTFFIGEFNEGGAERVISIIANNLIERGFDIEILKYHQGDNLYLVDSKVKINSVEENTKTRKNLLKNLLWMRNRFKDNSDIVISFLAPFNILSLLSHGSVPIIVADRNDPRFVPSSKFRRILRDFLYNFANAVVVQTTHNKEYFSKLIQKKTEVIFNPIDIKDNKGLALKANKKNTIVSVGRLEQQKNQDMLIDAFYEISKEFKDFKLIIYGEGSYRKELETKINDYGLDKKVLLPGNKKDILEKMSDAKVYVCSSNYEGMSNSLIEAMCIGLPVISTKVSGTEDLIENNINGILIDINDKESLIDNLRILLKNPDIADNMAKNAIEIADKLETNKIVDKWVELIKKVSK